MILPIRYMWEQLNGPQASALSNALFEYWKQLFDTKLDYFNNLTIETANDAHLTLFGLLSGLVRPNISEPDREFFYFTEHAEHPSDHGFSDLANPGVGGRLTKVDVGESKHNVSLDTEYYRALLRAWVSGQGEIGSLQLLDDICLELTKRDLGGDAEPFNKFVFMEGENIPRDRAPGDVFVDMRTMASWNNPMHVYAVLNGIAESVYAPQPRLFISLGTTSTVSTPVATPAGGAFTTTPIEVTLNVTSPTAGVTIYYTLDGSTPTRDSNVYTGPITITETTTLKAFGVAEYYGDSQVLTQVYRVNS